MRKILITLAFLFLAFPVMAASFTVTSSTIRDKQTLPDLHVFSGFGCTGKNISPALTWTDPPKGTKSIAITMYDPDAPTGSGWWHWTLFNLSAATRSISQGAGSGMGGMPRDAVMGMNDYGNTYFGGACPPKGNKPHNYVITVWALGIDKIPLNSKATGAMVGYYLNANALGKATMTATYGR